MSVAARPFRDGRNAYTDANGETSYACCDGRAPVPFVALVMPFPSQRPKTAAMLRAKGIDPDLLWCHSCATVLEQVRDGFEAGGPIFLRVVASVAAYVPGIGTGVAAALSAAAALASGMSIDEALIEAAKGAIPAGAVFEAAYETGAALARGQRIDQAALAAGRSAVRSVGGDLAAAAFDAVIAVAQGEALQEAGFAGLRYLAKGNDLAQRGIDFADKIATAAIEGRDVRDVLVTALAQEAAQAAAHAFGGVVKGYARGLVEPLVDRMSRELDLRDVDPSKLAFALQVPEAIVRVAQAVTGPGGSVDEELLEELAPRSGVAVAVEKYGAEVSATQGQTYAEAQSANREAALMSAARITPGSSFAAARAALAPPKAAQPLVVAAPRPVAPAVVAAAAPRTSRSTAGQDVLLGVTVAAALGALYWWATDGKAA